MDFDKYKNKENYPEKPKKPSKISCKMPTDWREYADRLESWDIEMVSYNANWKEYNKRSKELQNQFKIDALKDVGLEGHPNSEKVYNKAWEFGHSNGLESVYHYLVEFSELVF